MDKNKILNVGKTVLNNKDLISKMINVNIPREIIDQQRMLIPENVLIVLESQNDCPD